MRLRSHQPNPASSSTVWGSARADVSRQRDLQALVVRSISEFGSIDLLINNAGLLLTLAYHRVYPREIDDIVRVNLTGPMFLSWLVLPGMLERGSGDIVNVASLAGKYGPVYNELYSSTKAALIAFTQSLRASYRGSGASASVVCPGFVESGMYERSRRHGPARAADARLDHVRGRRRCGPRGGEEPQGGRDPGTQA